MHDGLEIFPKWSSYCTVLLLNTPYSNTFCLLSLSYCCGFGQISRRQNAFAAQIKQTWSRPQSFPIISRFIEGNISSAPSDMNEGQIWAFPHLNDLIWLSIDSDLLLWPAIKKTAVFPLTEHLSGNERICVSSAGFFIKELKDPKLHKQSLTRSGVCFSHVSASSPAYKNRCFANILKKLWKRYLYMSSERSKHPVFFKYIYIYFFLLFFLFF